MLPPLRAVWPLPPLPLVLPWPLPSPQPTRFFRCTAPFTFFSSWSFMDFPREGRRASSMQRATRIYFEMRSARFAGRRNIFGKAELAEAFERRVHDSDVVRGTHRLRENVLHAGGFEDRTHTTTSDEAGAGRRGLEHDAA